MVGTYDKDRLSGVIHNLPDCLSEIYLHPATGPFAGAAPDYRYRKSLTLLWAPDIVAAAREPSLRLGGFSRFPGAPDGDTLGRISRSDRNRSVMP